MTNKSLCLKTMSSPPSDLVNCFPCCPLPPGTEPSTIASITLKLWRPFQEDSLTLIENIYIHLHWWFISWSFHDTKKAAYLCWKCVKFPAGGWYMLDSPVTWTSSWGWPCPPRSRSWRCWGCRGCSTSILDGICGETTPRQLYLRWDKPSDWDINC